jgi:hypothetical protein
VLGIACKDFEAEVLLMAEDAVRFSVPFSQKTVRLPTGPESAALSSALLVGCAFFVRTGDTNIVAGAILAMAREFASFPDTLGIAVTRYMASAIRRSNGAKRFLFTRAGDVDDRARPAGWLIRLWAASLLELRQAHVTSYGIRSSRWSSTSRAPG